MELIRRYFSNASILTLFILVFCDISFSRIPYNPDGLSPNSAKANSDIPYASYAVHNIGKIGLTIANQGIFGTGFISKQLDSAESLRVPSCVYPYPGVQSYLFSGALWIGAVVDRDTLVSVGADGWSYIREMWPDPHPSGQIIRRSILDPDDESAFSEQDFIATYTDTLTDPFYVDYGTYSSRPHIPLNIEVTQRSYAWSYLYAEDFVLFDCSIKNIGRKELEDLYVGIYVDGDVMTFGSLSGFDDDICGFRRELPFAGGCGFIDTVNIAWIADNDGRHEPQSSCPEAFGLTSVTGIQVINAPGDPLKFSFNWWISNTDPSLDFGPRKIGTPEDPFRDFGGFLGTPEGDKNKYYIMRHEEFDYDQLFTIVDQTAEGWLPPPSQAADFADGYDTRYLLSFGPFDISPGVVLPITFAYVAGENFHTDCEAFERLFIPYYPYPYDEYLNFADLGLNATWASWIYDNPGYDTDGDKYRGKYRICAYDSTFVLDTVQTDPLVVETTVVYLEADTLWYEGDGVPDFRGASPPSPPIIRVTPRLDEFYRGELSIRWNGLKTQTERDVFSNRMDFEGYRVYKSLSSRASDFVLATSYDLEDYNKYIWNDSRGLWELRDPPFTIDSLRELYPGIDDPNNFNRDHIFYWLDSAFYFTRQDWNCSDLRDTNFIHKIYPDELPPTVLDPDSAAIYYPDELTGEGYFKYYEYEYTLRNLLPSQLYYVSVTAFDQGSPKSGMTPLESNPTMNMVAEYAQHQTSRVEAEGLEVVVYPNPYRIDGDYRSQEGGYFEGRGREYLSDDQVRAIHFANLPHKCTIRIFTIDGDMVREIDHDYPPDSPGSMHEIWDVLSGNSLLLVSGIYYYSVESEFGNQIGKIVIIL